MLRYTTDRARPGLVHLYDIWPGNRAGLFLQPWNLHGATNKQRDRERLESGKYTAATEEQLSSERRGIYEQ